MKFHHIWGVKQKNSPYMLRIIVFCAVKIANREKETETRKGDRIDDQTRKFNLSEAVSLWCNGRLFCFDGKWKEHKSRKKCQEVWSWHQTENKVENIVTIRKGSKEVSGSRLKKTGVPEAVFYCPFCQLNQCHLVKLFTN